MKGIHSVSVLEFSLCRCTVASFSNRKTMKFYVFSLSLSLSLSLTHTHTHTHTHIYIYSRTRNTHCECSIAVAVTARHIVWPLLLIKVPMLRDTKQCRMANFLQCYLLLHMITNCHLWLHFVTHGYQLSPMVTYCYTWLPTVTCGYLLLHIYRRHGVVSQNDWIFINAFSRNSRAIFAYYLTKRKILEKNNIQDLKMFYIFPQNFRWKHPLWQMHGHYFIWQLLAATPCRLVYGISVAQ